MRTVVGLLKTMRPKQWTKNVFLFVGLVFDGQLFVVDPLIRVIAGFALFCAASSAVYILNDLVDIERDRQHPKKKYRPIPSGQLPIPIALGALCVLPIVTVLVALHYSLYFTIIIVLYFFINVLYSFVFKHIVIIDVMTVTAGFVLRVAGGVFIITVERFSPWLYAVMALLALFLAIGKRRQELVSLGEHAAAVRPIFQFYNLQLLDEMLRLVLSSTLIAYILYTIEAPSILLAQTNLALLTVPFVMYGLFRYMYLIYVRGEGAAPDEVLLQDRPLQLSVVLWAITFVVVLYWLPSLIHMR